MGPTFCARPPRGLVHMGGGSFSQPVGNHDTARLRRPTDRSAHRVGRAWFNVPSVGKKLLRVVHLRAFSFYLVFFGPTAGRSIAQEFTKEFLARMSAMQLLLPSRPKVTLICHGDDAWQSSMELAKTVLSRTRPSTSSAPITEMDCRRNGWGRFYRRSGGLHQRILRASLCVRHIAQAKGGWMCPAAKSRGHSQSCEAHTLTLETTSSSFSSLPSSLSSPWCSSFVERTLSRNRLAQKAYHASGAKYPQRLQHTQVIGSTYLKR